uniref:Uncharacterized protein n=1 Tax=Gasterosteus aculeatus aculeatus TaxID=481459 RepID=A0AAQ4PDU7_GASAC
MQESLQQQVEQVSSLLEEAGRPHLPAALLQQASHLQAALVGSLGGVGSLREELEAGVELQQQCERLVGGLEELLALGSERLARRPVAELQTSARLQRQLAGHTGFFRFLGHRFQILQQLTQRVPKSAQRRWEAAVTGLQAEVSRMQQHALDEGTRMQETLQMWSLWEEDSAWTDSLLRDIETSFPKMHEGDNSELGAYQERRGVLQGSRARFSRMLEAGLWLKVAGCGGVGASTRSLEARWRALHRKVELKHTDVERRRKLRSRFCRDSAALAEWMGGARELIDQCRQLSAEDEVDVEQRRDHYLKSVTLTKELEAKSQLKAAVVCVGTQLVELREEDRDPDGGLEDPDRLPVPSQLRRVELHWSGLQADAPVLQRALHERWMKTLSQQEALLELQAWLEVAESRLEEHRGRVNGSSASDADLGRLLRCCEESRAEMTAHRATLDYLSRPLHTCGTEDGQRGRQEHNQFAEEQGRLNHRWLRLLETLDCQLDEVQQEMRSRAEQEARLQQINSWIADQNRWMDSARTPSSLTELQRSVDAAQEKIEHRAAALQESRGRLVGGGTSSRDLIARTEKSIQACAALTQQ